MQQLEAGTCSGLVEVKTVFAFLEDERHGSMAFSVFFFCCRLFFCHAPGAFHSKHIFFCRCELARGFSVIFIYQQHRGGTGRPFGLVFRKRSNKDGAGFGGRTHGRAVMLYSPGLPGRTHLRLHWQEFTSGGRQLQVNTEPTVLVSSISVS